MLNGNGTATHPLEPKLPMDALGTAKFGRLELVVDVATKCTTNLISCAGEFSFLQEMEIMPRGIGIILFIKIPGKSPPSSGNNVIGTRTANISIGIDCLTPPTKRGVISNALELCLTHDCSGSHSHAFGIETFTSVVFESVDESFKICKCNNNPRPSSGYGINTLPNKTKSSPLGGTEKASFVSCNALSNVEEVRSEKMKCGLAVSRATFRSTAFVTSTPNEQQIAVATMNSHGAFLK